MERKITKITQLITLFGAATLAISLIPAQFAWAQGGPVHHGAAVYDPLFPVVGDPVGTPYPAEYYEIARGPQDLPAAPLEDGGTIIMTAHDSGGAEPIKDAYISTKDHEASWAGGGKDVAFNFFAFGGGMTDVTDPKVPGPFLRVTEGNTVNIELTNLGSETHTIDFHAALGAKGGAALLAAEPGETSNYQFVAASPGLYIYHCVGDGSPHGIAHHMNNGMVGLILVEPRIGSGPGTGVEFRDLTANATEHYVLEFDVFRDPKTADFDEAAMVDSQSPSYVVYNGRVGALVDNFLLAQTGSNAVIYHGAAGVHPASFHIIGEIFDWVFDHGDIVSPAKRYIQTQIIPSAGAAVLIMDGDQLVPTSGGLSPDLNILVDHQSDKFRKGALGVMVVVQP